MSNGNEPAKYDVKGNDLTCPICQGERFYLRGVRLRGEQGWHWGLFMGTDTDAYICANCGYVCWFIDPSNFE